MNLGAQPAHVVRFGIFEADLVAGELRKRGRKVELQDQPFHVLALLLQRPKDLVTREELRQALWPADTFVEFDESLNKAVQKLRQALGDSADNPHFIETLPRKGYRFIGSIEVDQRRHGVLWAAAALVVAGAAGTAFWFYGRQALQPDAVLVPVPLTSYPGQEGYPSFSPDGTQVAFDWCPEGPGKNCDIYIKQIGVETPFRLTDNPADDSSPAWSPDGQTVAFLRDVSPSRVAVVLVPHRKGPERVLVEFEDFRRMTDAVGPYLAWTPDSKWVVSVGSGDDQRESLFLVSVDTGEKRKLTSPPSTGTASDTNPAISPDGRTLVFTRQGYPSTDLYLLRLTKDYTPEGEPERIVLDNPWNSGAAWLPDGKEILFTSGKSGSYGIWRMKASKSARPRKLSSGSGVTPAVSRQGNRLVFAVGTMDMNIWRVELQGRGRKPGTPTKLVSSSRIDYEPEYSPDGKRIAFLSKRSGTLELWMCDSDGSDPVKLTSIGGTDVMGTQWSPDGESIAFSTYSGTNQDIYVVSLKGGPPRRLTTQPGGDQWPYWSRDGQWLYFCSLRPAGYGDNIWKKPASGGSEVQVTRNDGDYPQESPDGKFVYYEKGWPSQCSVWKIPVEGGEETKILDAVHPYGKWTVEKNGIYYFTPPDDKQHADLRFYEFTSGKTRGILTIEAALGPHIAVSPDQRAILYSQWDEGGSDLMLVENFR